MVTFYFIFLTGSKKGDEKMRKFIHEPAEVSCNGELYKRSDTASITQLKKRLKRHNNENTLRFYKYSPDSYNLQIRTHKGIGEHGEGKPRNMIANIHVSKEDIQALMDYVNDNPPF
jgi:hypothetical protein